MVERFANGHKTQPLIDSLNMIKERMEQDYRLREIIEDSLTYCERCLEDEDFRRDPDSMERGVELVRRSRSYIFKRHREDVEHIFRETSSFLNDLQRDPLTQELSEDMTKVTEQLFVKEGGQVKPNPSLLRDALVVLLPVSVFLRCLYEFSH